LARAAAGLDLCVHCGFCLQACPTYIATRDENDSPRGRLFLMRAVVEGELPETDEDFHSHIDRCLGCRGCESACPSGVPYGALLEATRATIAMRRPIQPIARLVLAVMANDGLRSVVLGIARLVRATRLSSLLARLPGRAGFAFAMLESSRPSVASAGYAPNGSPVGRRVAVLRGCVMEGLFGHTNRATERVLAANGFALTSAPGQGCCGALHAHAGDLDGARTLARRNVAAFGRGGADVIVTNAAGCGAMMKEYGHLLADDPQWRDRALAVAGRVRDVTEVLAESGPRQGAPLPLSIAYDAPCHLLHAQRVSAQPIAVMRGIPSVEVTPLPDADQCCGGAGIYNLLEPELSADVLRPKLAHVEAARPQLVATANPGCHLQIGAGLIRAGSRVRCVHPVELLDASYARRAHDEANDAPPVPVERA
jgi:glycolate oxidase iron-sulfur subunit